MTENPLELFVTQEDLAPFLSDDGTVDTREVRRLTANRWVEHSRTYRLTHIAIRETDDATLAQLVRDYLGVEGSEEVMEVDTSDLEEDIDAEVPPPPKVIQITPLPLPPKEGRVVLVTYPDDLQGRGGYEELQSEGNISRITTLDALKEELKKYDHFFIYGVPSYRVLEALDLLREEGTPPSVTNVCYNSAKRLMLKIHTKNIAESPDLPAGVGLDELLAGGILEDPTKYIDTFWGSLIYRQERILTLAGEVWHPSPKALEEVVTDYKAQEVIDKHRVVTSE